MSWFVGELSNNRLNCKFHTSSLLCKFYLYLKKVKLHLEEFFAPNFFDIVLPLTNAAD